MGYYNIVNGNIKLYIIVCEKLGTCPCLLAAGLGLAKSLILLGFSCFSLYFLGAPNRGFWAYFF